MTIQFGKQGNKPLAILSDYLSIEEAEELMTWMDNKKQGQRLIDLGDCQHLHAAVLDVLIEKKARIHVRPRDPFVSSLLTAFEL